MKPATKLNRLNLIKKIATRQREWDRMAAPPAECTRRMKVDTGSIQYIEEYGKHIRTA